MAAAAVLLIGLAGCGAKHSIADKLTPDALFERALADLNAHHWGSAAELFERFTLQYPSHPRLQEARYHMGEAFFGKKEYITAATEFSRLANDYPAGAYADDARYKVCESYYRLSPKPQLDQQYTRAAMDHCQSLITYYSTSEFAPQAQKLLLDLKTKLATKDFLNGEFYFKRNAYDPAMIYYEAVARDYPETDVAPRALLRIYESYRVLNYKEEMDATKQRLLKDYPNSPEAKQLQQPPAATS